MRKAEVFGVSTYVGERKRTENDFMRFLVEEDDEEGKRMMMSIVIQSWPFESKT